MRAYHWRGFSMWARGPVMQPDGVELRMLKRDGGHGGLRVGGGTDPWLPGGRSALSLDMVNQDVSWVALVSAMRQTCVLCDCICCIVRQGGGKFNL